MKRIYFSKMLFITLVVISLCAPFAHAATLEVGAGKPYSTIQSAIDAAVNGDTVLVYDGTYVENIDFHGKAITVKSVNGASTTIIDGNASDSVVKFWSGEDATSVLDGFTIKNGYSEYGGGIYCYNSSSPTITNCTISRNTATEHGGGIFCYYSSPTLINCIITENMATGYSGFGGGIYCSDSSPVITNCTITENMATEYGGGIYCDYHSSPVITNCTITRNTALNDNGGGIACYNSSSPTITNCTISRNRAAVQGGGVASYESSPIITNCTISRNMATGKRVCGIHGCGFLPGYGGGIYCDSYSSPTVKNTILWGDIALEGKEIYLSISTITITYSDVQRGWAGEGNIHANPLFVGNGDYHLRAGSPCINAGTVDGAPDYDIDGDTRPQGAGYDMGSDEYIRED